MSRYGPLGAAAGLIAVAAVAEFEENREGSAGALLGASLVILGAWMAAEVWREHFKDKDKED